MISELSQNPVENRALPLQFIMVTGTSGSGKTQALKCLEDLGFFCVDNLPPALFQKFTELCAQPGKDVKKVALGIDIRERAFFDDLLSNLEALQAHGSQVELLFLEAQDDILVRRFSESRRPHPLLPQRPVIEGIQLERERLQALRSRAHRVLDTSAFSVHDLKAWMIRHYQESSEEHALKVSLLSFGYKFGVPVDVDLVFDVRFLRNPHFVPDLQPLTGEYPEIQQFVLENQEGKDFLGHLRDLFGFLLPLFEREQRNYLTIAFGCTGGRHRSVAMVLSMKDILKALGYDVTLRHREIKSEQVET
ncbi:MAG: RNase adapter RapZ [Nitrospirota bacterium]|nr:RNase adapter RapZ [Nitrospirota bacterium]